MAKQGKKPKPLEAKMLELLRQFAGDRKAKAMLARLLDDDAPASRVAEEVARLPAFERLYKVARTTNIGVDSVRDADPAFVGLVDYDAEAPFREQFARSFRPRLAARAEGFEVLFQALQGLGRSPFMVETGCLRIPDNWEGDGQSTFMFDALARDTGGALFSIDVGAESIDTARKACSSATQLIENDSVAALHALASIASRRIDLLYLDSFDLDASNPLPSAIHHALELTAARPLVGSGTLVCIDDYSVGSVGGKGMIVDKFMAAIRAEVLYSGYQKLWRIP